MANPEHLRPTNDAGPIPEENLPGHHPPVEQDKPTRPPRGRARNPKDKPEPLADPVRFGFDFDPMFERFDRLLGIRPNNSYIEVAGDRVTVRFGPWRIQTTKSNVIGAEVTGPFAWWKVAGLPHLSLRDRGLTMASSTQKGVCIRFRTPVKGIEPTGMLRHPGLTVTPDEPDRLVEALMR